MLLSYVHSYKNKKYNTNFLIENIPYKGTCWKQVAYLIVFTSFHVTKMSWLVAKPGLFSVLTLRHWIFSIRCLYFTLRPHWAEGQYWWSINLLFTFNPSWIPESVFEYDYSVKQRHHHSIISTEVDRSKTRSSKIHSLIEQLLSTYCRPKRQATHWRDEKDNLVSFSRSYYMLQWFF